LYGFKRKKVTIFLSFVFSDAVKISFPPAFIFYPVFFYLSWHMNCVFINQNIFMRKNQRGELPGSNKNGRPDIKPVMPAENLEGREEMSKKYTKDVKESAKKRKERHPGNRNKRNSTNAGASRQ
jgi:hypothetical protein